MLTAHAVLAERNEDLTRAERWVADLLAHIDRPTDRHLVTAYATWRVLRRLRNRAGRNPGPRTPTASAKLQLGAADALLDWLADHHLALADAGQADNNTWLVTGPAAYHARDFLAWAGEQGHCQLLTVPTATRRTGTALEPDTRWQLLARLLHDDTIRFGAADHFTTPEPLATLIGAFIDTPPGELEKLRHPTSPCHCRWCRTPSERGFR